MGIFDSQMVLEFLGDGQQVPIDDIIAKSEATLT